MPPYKTIPISSLSLSFSLFFFLSPLLSLPIYLSLSPDLPLSHRSLSRRRGLTVVELRRGSGRRPDGMAKLVRRSLAHCWFVTRTTCDQESSAAGSSAAGSNVQPAIAKHTEPPVVVRAGRRRDLQNKQKP